MGDLLAKPAQIPHNLAMPYRGEIQFMEWIWLLVLRAVIFSRLFSALPAFSAETAAPAWMALRQAGVTAFQETRYLDALGSFQRAYEAAVREDSPDEVRGRLLTSVGACLMGLGDYGGALRHFLEARPLTLKGGNREDLAALDANLASVYLFQDDRENAVRLYQRALGWLDRIPQSRHRPSILANLAAVELRAGRPRTGLRYAEQGLRELGPSAPVAQQAALQELAGQAYLLLRKCGRAREAFERGLELGGSAGVAADVSRSWMFLGRTELECGDAAAALIRLNEAVRRARDRDGRVTLWEALYWRGRCLRKLGRPEGAVRDLQEAVQVLEALRVGLVPTDALRIQFEAFHHDAYRALADLLCEAGDSPGAFHVVEQGRAQSLREMLRARPRPAAETEPSLWTRYADRLAHLETARVRALAASGDQVQAWRARLAGQEAAVRELEAQMRVQDPGLGRTVLTPAVSLAEAQKTLEPGALLLNFHVGENGAWLWALTAAEAKLYRLPDPAEWSAATRSFPAALQAAGPATTESGRRLYRRLLGVVEPSLLDRPQWIIAANGDLAVLPFHALTTPAGRYVVEEHAVSYIPSITVLRGLRSRPAQEYRADFLGLADPVVNRADPRGAGAVRCDEEHPCVALPRLASSGAEVQACARLFRSGRATILSGLNASEAQVQEAARRGYRYWHFSTHVVADTQRPNLSFLALTLPDKLTVFDVLDLGARTEMVTVNGCSSGTGKLLAGAGLIGLARAFLAAGAQSVCATRWQIPDEEGALVRSVYTHLLAGLGRAEALRRAQIEMIRGGGWRAQPRYWAAYFLIGDGSGSPQ